MTDVKLKLGLLNSYFQILTCANYADNHLDSLCNNQGTKMFEVLCLIV